MDYIFPSRPAIFLFAWKKDPSQTRVVVEVEVLPFQEAEGEEEDLFQMMMVEGVEGEEEVEVNIVLLQYLFSVAAEEEVVPCSEEEEGKNSLLFNL
jgi:hypothetical protein